MTEAKTIIVTGAAGFIGSRLCHWLLQRTVHTVIGIDNMSTGSYENLPGGSDHFKFYKHDISNKIAIESVFKTYRPSYCFHLAAYAAEGRSNYIRSFILQNNGVGTANIINACINNKTKLIFTSSVAVYSGKPPFYEFMPPNPIDEYGLDKWHSERSIAIAGDQQGLDYVILRLRNVYGENQCLADPARNVFGIWMYQVKKGEPITIFGDGQQTRAFTYIGDILQPMFNCIRSTVSKEIINLGSPIYHTINTAAKLFNGITGNDKIKNLPARHEIADAWCLTKKSEALLGFKEKTFLSVGLSKMWNWAKDIPLPEKLLPPPLEVAETNHPSIT